MMRAAPPGTGIIAGGPMRAVCEALGMHDIVGKSLGSTNPHNMVKATFAALVGMIVSPRLVAAKRGKKVARDPRPARQRRGRRREGGVGPWRDEGQGDPGQEPDRPAATTSEQTLIGLGLNKLHRTRVLADTPAIRGLIDKVKHLLVRSSRSRAASSRR